jgi:RNA polymerase sigma-70 factor (ECF subfamily)
VLAAGSPESTRYQKALETLCQAYWFPLYAYLRRRGYDKYQAEDHTQSFFVYLLEKPALSRADPKRGKFRSFLLSSLKHFVADERDRVQARKRGGNKAILSLDFEDAERRYSQEPVHDLSPERLFERWWALHVLNRATHRLKTEAKTTHKAQLFERLKGYLVAEKGTDTYKSIASEFDMSETAVRVTAHRLKQRFNELVREEIAQTVTNNTHIDEEIKDLFTALTS